MSRPVTGRDTAYYRFGFSWAIEQGYDTVVQMDADGSHPRDRLPALLDALVSGGADQEDPLAGPLPSPPGVLCLAVPQDHLAERAGWAAVSLAVLTLGLTTWSDALAFQGAALAEMALVGIALFSAYRCWASPGPPTRRSKLLLLAALAVAIGVMTAAQLASASFYGTDSVALGQYSAHLVLEGLNAFTHSLAPGLLNYAVPVSYTTHTLTGATITL